jgi:dephospho-CoA kinase
MFTVGLTGGIGSGKSTVADLFAELGVPVIDTDVIARELTVPGSAALEAIHSAFGDEVIRPDGSLDRAALRRLVFADADARHRLESILHPRIRQAVEQVRAGLSASYILLVIPLLVETDGYRDLLDRVLVVDCPEELQITRVIARNGLARDEVLPIVAAQARRSERLAIADDVIVNTLAREALRAEVVTLNQRYLMLSHTELP